MWLFVESSLIVLVTVSSKSVYICNRFHAKVVNSGLAEMAHFVRVLYLSLTLDSCCREWHYWHHLCACYKNCNGVAK